MKIIKTIFNDKNKISIYQINKNKFVDKTYTKKNFKYFKNEISGYQFYKKNYVYKIPKFYSYQNKKNIKILTIEYIDGTKVNIFNFSKVFKKKIKITKKISYTKYTDHISNFYFKKKNKKIEKLKNNINKYLQKNIINSKLKLSFTHGDLAHFNCLKKKNYINVFDFEKFKERIFLFDHINWLYHPFISNVGLIMFSKNFMPKSTLLLKFIFYYFETFIFHVLKKNLNLHKIDRKNFKIFYLIYLYEKLSILSFDINLIKNFKRKNLARKLIIIILKNIDYIIKK